MGCGPWRGSSSILPPVFYPPGGVVGNGQGWGEFSRRASPRVMEVKPPSPTPNCCHLCVIQKVPNTLSNILECILVFKIATSFYYFLRITFECVCISMCVQIHACAHTRANGEVRGPPWLFVSCDSSLPGLALTTLPTLADKLTLMICLSLSPQLWYCKCTCHYTWLFQSSRD